MGESRRPLYTLIGNYTYFAGQQPVIPIAQRTEDYVFEQVLDNAYVTPLTGGGRSGTHQGEIPEGI